MKIPPQQDGPCPKKHSPTLHWCVTQDIRGAVVKTMVGWSSAPLRATLLFSGGNWNWHLQSMDDYLWIFQLLVKGGRWHIITQLAVCTAYIPGIYLPSRGNTESLPPITRTRIIHCFKIMVSENIFSDATSSLAWRSSHMSDILMKQQVQILQSEYHITNIDQFIMHFILYS